MKKIITVLLALIMMMGFSACGSNNPETVTEEFLTAVKEQNQQELLVYMEDPAINVLINNMGYEAEVASIFESITKNLSWEIIEVKEGEDKTKASVIVKISNSDFSGVLETYQTEAVKYTTDNLASDVFTKEKMANECVRIFTQHVKAAAVEDTISEQEIEVNLYRYDNKRWHLELTEELRNAILGGLTIAL